MALGGYFYMHAPRLPWRAWKYEHTFFTSSSSLALILWAAKELLTLVHEFYGQYRTLCFWKPVCIFKNPWQRLPKTLKLMELVRIAKKGSSDVQLILAFPFISCLNEVLKESESATLLPYFPEIYSTYLTSLFVSGIATCFPENVRGWLCWHCMCNKL